MESSSPHPANPRSPRPFSIPTNAVQAIIDFVPVPAAPSKSWRLLRDPNANLSTRVAPLPSPALYAVNALRRKDRPEMNPALFVSSVSERQARLHFRRGKTNTSLTREAETQGEAHVLANKKREASTGERCLLGFLSLSAIELQLEVLKTPQAPSTARPVEMDINGFPCRPEHCLNKEASWPRRPGTPAAAATPPCRRRRRGCRSPSAGR